MPNSVTFNVVDNNNNKTTRTYTCLTENKSFINSIITVGKDNTIKETDINKLIAVAKRSGDAGIIEQSDLNGQEKLNLALANKFSDYYDIKLSNDGKYFQVTIKDVGMFCMDPNLDTIKNDFGVKDDVFVKKGEILHGNDGVIPDSTGGAGFDSIIIKTGQTINIPVSEINIDGSPRGGFGRFISFLGN